MIVFYSTYEKNYVRIIFCQNTSDSDFL